MRVISLIDCLWLVKFECEFFLFFNVLEEYWIYDDKIVVTFVSYVDSLNVIFSFLNSKLFFLIFGAPKKKKLGSILVKNHNAFHLFYYFLILNSSIFIYSNFVRVACIACKNEDNSIWYCMILLWLKKNYVFYWVA